MIKRYNKNNLSQKILFFSFLMVILSCAILMIARIYNSISLTEPLQLITTGADEEQLIAIWQTKTDLFSYSNHFKYPYTEIVDKNLHTPFLYNWFFYQLYGQLINIIQVLLNLNDFWLPTLVRILTFIFTLVSTFFLILIFHIKEKKLNFYLFLFASFILLGPLTGFFAISSRPDISALMFELICIYYFLKNIDYLTTKKIFIISCLLYLSWACKQTHIITILSIPVFLIYKRNISSVVKLTLFLSSKIFLTIFIGGRQYIENITYINAPLEYSFLHFINGVLFFSLKTIPIFFLLFILVYSFQNKKVRDKYIFDNDIQLFSLIAIIFSTISLILYFQTGSSVNYFYIPTIYLSIFIIPAFKKITNKKQFYNHYEKNFFSASLLLQSLAILAILFGIKGTVTPFYYDKVEQYAKCVKFVKGPVYTHHNYLRMPWITPSKNPIMTTYWYALKNKNVNLENTEIYQLIKKGFFETIILPDLDPSVFDTSKYTFYKKCTTQRIFVKK